MLQAGRTVELDSLEVRIRTTAVRFGRQFAPGRWQRVPSRRGPPGLARHVAESCLSRVLRNCLARSRASWIVIASPRQASDHRDRHKGSRDGQHASVGSPTRHDVVRRSSCVQHHRHGADGRDQRDSLHVLHAAHRWVRRLRRTPPGQRPSPPPSTIPSSTMPIRLGENGVFAAPGVRICENRSPFCSVSRFRAMSASRELALDVNESALQHVAVAHQFAVFAARPRAPPRMPDSYW